MAPIIPRHLLPAVSGTAAALSILQAFVGLRALIQPQFGLSLISFPEPADEKQKNIDHGLVRRFAARDVAIGLSALVMYHNRNYRGLGTTVLIGSFITVIDGLVSRDVIGSGEWSHWCFTPVNLIFGAGVLRIV